MSTITFAPTASSLGVRPAAPMRSGQFRSGQLRSGRSGSGRVRLTRRGQLAVVLAGLMLMLTTAFVWGGGSAATEHAGVPEATRVVTVAPGDTLWDIAADLAEDGEVRSMVDRIERLNALDSAMLQAGQRIRVPIGN